MLAFNKSDFLLVELHGLKWLLARVIRHSPAPAEDRNTELATIRFAQAHLAVTFVIDPKTRLGAPTAWGRRGSSPKNKKGC
jgi:hypothetical protein